MDDSVIFYTDVKWKGNTQITHMEETEKHILLLKIVNDHGGVNILSWKILD